LAAAQALAVVVEHLPDRAFVDDGLAALQARPFLPFEGLHGERTEFDPVDRAPGLLLPFEDADAVEARGLERGEEPGLGEGARDAAAPQLRVLLHGERDLLVAHDVR